MHSTKGIALLPIPQKLFDAVILMDKVTGMIKQTEMETDPKYNVKIPSWYNVKPLNQGKQTEVNIKNCGNVKP